MPAPADDSRPVRALKDAARLSEEKILNPELLTKVKFPDAVPVLVLLAAGRGTRFGTEPKCIQPVHGTPLARHSIESFRRLSPAPAICIVGHRHEQVAAALGADNLYVVSDDPAGGTAFAAYEAFSVPVIDDNNPLVVVSMGDRIVPPSIFRKLCETHRSGASEADLTFLTAIYESPKNRGKGRVIRDADRRVTGIIEERDILARPDTPERQAMLDLGEGNCPLYAIRASLLRFYLENFTNTNAQGQFYITDLISAIVRDGGDIRTVTTSPADPEYDLLCSDVTQPMDLALLEGTLASSRGLLFPEEVEVEEAARRIRAGRPEAQAASIARQLREIMTTESIEELGFDPNRPVGIGVSGGRLRIAFMHPDMGRFFGPAWQMPIGAGSEDGDEQIVVVVQAASDGRIHLFPIEQSYREKVNSLAPDSDAVYPGEEISDAHSYEGFGTRMSEHLLLSLGYFTDEEIALRREKGLPLPPHSLWAGNNMRRPFALVMNALASIRTLRQGNLGLRV
jgi:molybdopterin-guanine dinucleotide biosynthesis protein A